jgi:ABC-type branched-subunit amino acid transport system substrate-binding protein
VSNDRPWRGPLALAVAFTAMSLFALEPPEARRARQADALAAQGEGQEDEVAAGEPVVEGGTDAGDDRAGASGGPSRTGKGGSAGATGGSEQGSGASSVTPGRKGLQCAAGKNGGRTAPGVSGSRIKLAATNVRSGTGASFLGSSYIGMQAVANRVNAAGGICGRLLDLRLVDDGWEAARGATFIGNFARDDYFALPVVPSSEGLTQAISSNIVSGARIPVVGTDGMLKEQYQEPWVWPVATSTVSTMRVMAKYAHDNGARTFGIVYDSEYRFGLEGQKAFAKYVQQLTGKPPKAQVPLKPRQASYAGDAQRFNEACGPELCDFVAFLLTPETANTYVNSQPEKDGRKLGFGRLMSSGAQPLFNERFARDCKKACDGMLVWTGYNPPLADKDVAAYVDDISSVDPQVDETNQFLQGAYLGMKVFVAALEKVGPDLTRDRLREVLDSMTYTSGLSSSLKWGAGNRFANLGAQPFRITTSGGDFAGFAEVGTGFLRDPTPGVVE